MAGVLMRTGKGDRYVRAMLLGEMQLQPSLAKYASILQVEIREAFTPEKARLYSGIVGPGPEGVLAGAAPGECPCRYLGPRGWGHWSSIARTFYSRITSPVTVVTNRTSACRRHMSSKTSRRPYTTRSSQDCATS